MKKLLNLIHIIVLFCAYAPLFNQWITPQITPYWTTFALFFPITIIINIVLIGLWLLVNWKKGLLFFILSIPLVVLIKPIYPFWNKPINQEGELSLMSYNVRYFYDDMDGILNLTKERDPALLFLQEMGTDGQEFLDSLNAKKHYYFENYNSLGIASIYPIIETSKIEYKDYPLTAIYCDVAMPKDTIRLINVYLESLHLDQNEIKNTKINTEDVNYKSRMLVSKVSKAAEVHYNQINLIQKLVKKSPHPIILAGDLNAVPSSFEYYRIKEGLEDAFPIAGNQLGNSFHTLKVPLKLDYVFSSKTIQPISYEILKVKYSDHYPTFVDFKIQESTQ